MYVCTYVFMCMYVCACMYAYTCVGVGVWVCGWLGGWVGGWVSGRVYIHISAKGQRKNGHAGGGGEDTAFWALGCLGFLAAHHNSNNHFAGHAVGTSMLEAQTRVAHRYLPTSTTTSTTSTTNTHTDTNYYHYYCCTNSRFLLQGAPLALCESYQASLRQESKEASLPLATGSRPSQV